MVLIVDLLGQGIERLKTQHRWKPGAKLRMPDWPSHIYIEFIAYCPNRLDAFTASSHSGKATYNITYSGIQTKMFIKA